MGSQLARKVDTNAEYVPLPSSWSAMVLEVKRTKPPSVWAAIHNSHSPRPRSVMCAGSADPFSMHLVAWGALMAQCGVCEREGGGRGEGEAGGSAVRPADLDRIFLAANYEEDKASEESKVGLQGLVQRCGVGCGGRRGGQEEGEQREGGGGGGMGRGL